MLDKVLLFPYYLTLKLRHGLYNCGLKKVHTCNVPTICVGNITVGGTGKTPHTEMVLRTLLASEEWGMKNIAVLSRGYKRRSKGFQQVTRDGSAKLFGDEPLQIKKKFPAVTVAVDRDRVEGCSFLTDPEKLKTSRKARKCIDKEVPQADVIVLDDAFQYRALKAKYNIVLIDYNRPIYDDSLMPFGRLRDLPERIYEADMIIVTKCPAFMENWERTEWLKPLGITNFNPDTCVGTDARGKQVTVVFTSITYSQLEKIYDEGDPRYIYSKKAILFTGIAKDTPLRRFLSDSYKIVRHFRYGDHHKFSNSDIRSIRSAAEDCPTAVVITTEKDSQRVLDNKKVPGMLRERMFRIPIEVFFLSDNEKAVFETTLLNALKG
ncbi:MAG: tetraacyldisaccharide 4'-kinase [Bacteroidota bacterium]|nr:tetraacyldisaccharide 4'-kinase [Bacteroidota bacterium]